jgi:hypothetical protein
MKGLREAKALRKEMGEYHIAQLVRRTNILY